MLYKLASEPYARSKTANAHNMLVIIDNVIVIYSHVHESTNIFVSMTARAVTTSEVVKLCRNNAYMSLSQTQIIPKTSKSKNSIGIL